jgi:serine/threonine protein kinase
MGIVFSAKHLLLGERVAIKVLTRTVSECEEALKRLQREARILARLNDEHVVRVLDLGKLENGAPFIVMEHLAGRDLGSLLEEQGRFAPELAVGFVLQAAVALAAAHSSGVVHRDIKPENLFCVERGGSRLIKVLDFGVSRLERSRPDDFLLSSVTRTNTLVGTPLYMSPEQIRNAKEVDARSDIWSLGVVLYEFLAGVPPFMGASFGDVAVKIAAESMPPLTGVAEAIDPGLAAVVMRCLEKDRDARFQSVAELGRALCPFAPGSEQLIERIEYLLTQPASEPANEDEGHPAGESPDGAAVPAPSSVATPSSTPLHRQGRRLSRAGVAVGASAFLALLLAWHFAGPSAIEPRATSTLALASVGEDGSPPNASPKRPTVEPVVQSGVNIELSAEAGPESVPSAPPIKSRSWRLRAPVRSRASDDCNPPYTLDNDRRKKFKHECFIDRRVQ